MSKQAVFTMKLETELRDSFMAAAESEHRPASQVLRELMRQYIEQLAYQRFLQEKVDAARQSVEEDNSIDHKDAKALFAARRARIKAR
ncbi:antitoxin of toxin-antitoxin stability system [Erwiniaceae bacterium BAC15a-03b]|uniref:Antitoxin of toxin-antitoxin stability system n=1 Tax=Winslowiella arboricola TaxID=2978220 RepID=A0A9J6PT28_9GAMM|nr:antitoxin of toxin-antitoxin stability system [Winslowiella arboricola]MCU5775571.1 antitoxin of toxin-antitoxin stability system [Winslowiella arboricola]MCU5779579.1 antitoxin of toxin-antitoxin stability system [Winslowiella arboricola]